MSTDADAIAINPDLLAFLRENGVDPQVYLKRQAELRAMTRSPEEEAKLAEEQERLRPEIESYNRYIEEHGLWSDGLRPW
ncbi:MAG TPA: type II toxin-antitoxin system CcdA family antitoxin [Caulobacterales bacterium]|nr:type II toxin-antitoxin system CcdA family antitoxin [Caulobacterales bacterium]